MHQRHVVPRGPVRQLSWCVCVDAQGKLRLVFGAIDRGVGCGVDDEVGLEPIQRLDQRFRLRRTSWEPRKRGNKAPPT